MATYNLQTPTIEGFTPTYQAATANDEVPVHNENVFLIVKNTGAGADTVTVVVPGTEYGQQKPDVSVNVPATNGEVWIGPLDVNWADSTTHNVAVNHSVTAGVTVAAVAF